MNVLDPARVPVFLICLLVVSLFVLAPVARRRRLHVGHGMAVLMLLVGFSRIFFFDYRYEVFGEGSFYIGQMVAGGIPGLGPIYDIGNNPPGIFSLFYFSTHVIGLDPVVTLKAFRLVLGALDVLLVYLIGRRLFPERHLALGASVIFAWAEVQLTLFEGDQFKNLLGHTFFLAFVLVVIEWFEALGSGHPRHGRRLAMAMALSLGMILSHQVYAHVLVGILALAAVGLGTSVATQRVLGHRPGLWLAVLLIAAAGFGYALWFREFLPHLGAEGLIALTEYDYGGLSLVDEVRRPGIFFYNIWITLATIGALLCARREGHRKTVAFLLTLFGFFTILAKQYLVGLLFQPVRFLMIDGPFLSLFAVYGLWRLTSRVAGLGDRLVWIGVSLLVLANLSVMEFGSARLDLTRNGLRVPVSDASVYLFGGPAPDLQLWLLLLLATVLVAAVASASSESERSARIDRTLGIAGFAFLAAMIAGIILGIVWVVEPFVLHAMPLQFVALLFPVVVLGWLPWRAIDPGDPEDRDLRQLVMVSVTSLLVFVVVWYVILSSSIWAFGTGIRWSTVLTFLAPVGFLVGLGGTTRLGTRWRA